MAAHSKAEYQALKDFLLRYSEAQKQERRLADRLSLMDRELGQADREPARPDAEGGQEGAPDPQPGVSSWETIRDFFGALPEEEPLDISEKKESSFQGPGGAFMPGHPDASRSGMGGAGTLVSDPALEPGKLSQDMRPGFYGEPGSSDIKAGTGVPIPQACPGYPGQDIREGISAPSLRAGQMISQESGPVFYGYPLPGGGDASRIYREDMRHRQCREALARQQAVTEAALSELVKVLAYLPAESDRRYVLELRYLDALSWGMVAEVSHMSRSSVFAKATAGMRELLTHAEVREMVEGQ